jgi:hypothetical protein
MPWAPKKANAVAGLAQRGEGTSSTPRKEAAALVCPHRLPRLPFPGFRYALLIEISETDAPLRVIPGTKVFTRFAAAGEATQITVDSLAKPTKNTGLQGHKPGDTLSTPTSGLNGSAFS